MSITLVTTRDVADAYAKGRKDERAALDGLRGMLYFDLMLAELKRLRLKPRGPSGQGIPSPYDYANDALAALLRLIGGET